MTQLGSPVSDQVTPFAKRYVTVNSPTAEYDTIASNPTPPASPSQPDSGYAHINSKDSRSRSQTKRPRRNIGPYQLTRTLGSGSMGKVKLAINNDSGEKCAVKIIPKKAPVHKNAPKDESRDIRIHREIALMMLLHHPYIVSLKDAMIMPHHYYLFFEYVSGGQILDYIISHGKLKEKQARKFARQMLSAIEYCHRHSIVHRDLKIENILITEEGDIKIIDFGLSNLFSTQSHLSTFCGSLYFAAPELLSAQEYTGPEVDIWSLGIVFYVLVCGRVPFDDPNMPALHAKIKKGNVSYPNWLSKECKHLLTRMLVTNPQERATMAELIRHPWINKGYDELIDIHFPERIPIQLPLDMNVIHGMKGFEFGSEEKIRSDLEAILTHEQPSTELFSPTKIKDLRKKAFFNKNRQPTDGNAVNQPLQSIYHLVQEKLERKKMEEESKASSKNSVNLPSLTLSGDLSTHNHDILPEIPEPEEVPEIDSDKQNLTSPASRSIKFENPRDSHTSSGQRSPNVLRRLSSAVRPGKPPLFHRLSHGPDSSLSTGSPKEGYSEKFSRRLSRLITRHMSMQEPKQRNSMSELDSLVGKLPKSPLTQQVSSPPVPTTSHPTYESNVSPAGVVSPGDVSDEQQMTAKTMSLKGLFSVATTSTKKSKVINRDLIRVLQSLNVHWKETDGYLECAYISPSESVSPEAALNSEDSSDDTTSLDQQLPPVPENISTVLTDTSSNLLSPNKADISLSVTESSPQPSHEAEALRVQTARSETASKLTNTTSKTVEGKTANRVVRFQITLVKIRVVLRLHGIQFRRLDGPSWEYKSICSKILSELKL